MSSLRQIRASAGSGKTWTLTLNYINLLAASRKSAARRHAVCRGQDDGGGFEPGEILAITFTNAAAAEMRDRVVSRLKNIALGQPDNEISLTAPQAAQWLDELLRDPSSLNIRTIDSLLHLITRVSALELGLNPDFEEEMATRDAIAPYLETFMEEARNDGPMREMLRDACRAMINPSEGTGFLASTRIDSHLATALNGALVEKFAVFPDKTELENKLAELDAGVLCAAKDFQDAAADAGLVFVANAAKLLNTCLQGKTPEKRSAYLDKAEAAPLFKKDGTVTQKVEDAYARFAAACDAAMAAGPVLRQGLKYLPFINLARLLAQAFKDNCQKEGVVPIAMIPFLAARALEPEMGVSEALCRMGGALTHFLVDEFQDTSREQWSVLRALVVEALSRGGSLTWVGDVKQSIYGWRGADPALFTEIAGDTGLCAIAGAARPDHLDRNWRSLPNIVDFNNRFFKALADPARALEIVQKLAPADCDAEILNNAAQRLAQNFGDMRQECARTGGGIVVADTIRAPTTAALNELTVEKTRQLVHEILKRRRPGDILILARSNDKAALAAEALLNDGIAVVTENSLLLADHPLVIQYLALLSFLVNPLDDVAFWALVSGDIFASHPDGQFTANPDDWASGHGETPLSVKFQNDFPACWEKLLKPFHNQASLMTAYDTIMEWNEFMEVEKRFPSEKTFTRRFMEVAHLAETRGAASVAAFLEYWSQKGGDEKTPMPEHMDAVAVKTIHKAKGLQAPVVITPWTNFTIRPGHTLAAAEVDGIATPVMLDTRAAGSQRHAEITRQALEALNALYVAFTRAEEELYFFHGVAENDRHPGLHKVMDDIAGYAELALPFRLGEAGGAAPDSQNEQAAALRGQKDIPAACASPKEDKWLPMQWLPELKIFRSHAGDDELKATERGIFLHFCLERLRFEGSPREDAQAALNFGLRHSGINIPEDERLRNELLEILAWFAAIPQARGWIANGMSEHTMLDDKGNISRPDLMTPQPWGTLVIDYKSGSPHRNNALRMQQYLACLNGLKLRPGRAAGLLIYLDQKSFQIITENKIAPLRENADFSEADFL